ncbi:DUF3789 domain-containing protein [Enterococcus sp. AZ102]|uniref:DUF3789 domain-containing protein n=1 Tax=Enterococcus sp. AZ102 TaxID=2774865 RepID=UPI003F217BDD
MTSENLAYLIIGIIAGGAVGVVMMCLVQINRNLQTKEFDRALNLAEAIQKDIENLKMEDDYIEWKIDELVFLLMIESEDKE